MYMAERWSKGGSEAARHAQNLLLIQQVGQSAVSRRYSLVPTIWSHIIVCFPQSLPARGRRRQGQKPSLTSPNSTFLRKKSTF